MSLRLAMGCALLLGAVACDEPPAPPLGGVRGAAPDDALWVLTYNVNFEQPSDETVEAIREANADVVFLQETQADWHRRIDAELGEDVYPYRLVREASNEGGMMILSRHPLEDIAYLPSPAGAFPSWCVRVDSPLGPLDVLHVHLHPPLEDGSLALGYFTTGGRRAREVREYLSCFDRTPDLVLGDFNEETGEAVEHLAGMGLRQAQRALGPVERTWTWNTAGVELEGRPDHVFFGPRLRVRAVQVMQRGGSDHRPLRAAFVQGTR